MSCMINDANIANDVNMGVSKKPHVSKADPLFRRPYE